MSHDTTRPVRLRDYTREHLIVEIIKLREHKDKLLAEVHRLHHTIRMAEHYSGQLVMTITPHKVSTTCLLVVALASLTLVAALTGC